MFSGLLRVQDRCAVRSSRNAGKTKETTKLMKKADLVDVVAQQKNLPRPQVESTIDGLIDALADGLSRGERSTSVGSAPLRCANRRPARVATPKPAPPFKSRRDGCPPSKPARSSGTRSTALDPSPPLSVKIRR